MKTTLTLASLSGAREALRQANEALQRAYPGESALRQPGPVLIEMAL